MSSPCSNDPRSACWCASLGPSREGNSREREIVRGDQADRAVADEGSRHDPPRQSAGRASWSRGGSRRAGTAAGWGHARCRRCCGCGDLRVKPRVARLQRILDAQCRADCQGRQPQRGRSNRSAGQREHDVAADRSQQRALAGHVGAAHDEQSDTSKLHVIRHHLRCRHERMPQPDAVKRPGALVCEGWERVGGMFVGVRGQRIKRFVLPKRLNPLRDVRTEFAAPGFNRQGDLRRPQQERRHYPEQQIVLPVVHLREPMQTLDCRGGWDQRVHR